MPRIALSKAQALHESDDFFPQSVSSLNRPDQLFFNGASSRLGATLLLPPVRNANTGLGSSLEFSMPITESFVPARRVIIETLIGLGAATLEGIKRVGELNVQAGRDIVTEAGRAPEVLLSITSPQELMTLNFSLVEFRVQRVSAYGFQLQAIATSAGSEVSEVMRAGIAQVQSTILSADETSTQNAVVDALHGNGQDDGQADGQASAQSGEQLPMEATEQATEQSTSGAPSAHNASNGTQKSAPRTKSASANGHARNKNGSRARNGSEKSRKRSGGSGSGRSHAS